FKKRNTYNVVKVTSYISDEREYIIKYFASSTFSGIGHVNVTEIAEFYFKEYKSNDIENIISNRENLEELLEKERVRNLILEILQKQDEEDVIENDFNRENLNQRFLNVLINEIPDRSELVETLKHDFYNFAYKFGLAPFNDVDAVSLYYDIAP